MRRRGDEEMRSRGGGKTPTRMQERRKSFPVSPSPRPRVPVSLILGMLLTSLVSAYPVISQTPSPETPSKIVTGHYRLRNPETPNGLEVLQLPAGKIQFHLLAVWLSPNNRENVHNGELEGIIKLQGNKATYQTEGCKVTIRFFSSTATVIQDHKIGDCDFGANVTASGIYRKINSRKPKYGSRSLISRRNHQ
jgi:hypothetical protein